MNVENESFWTYRSNFQQEFNRDVLANSGIRLSQQYVTFEGRILSPPSIGLVVNRDRSQASLVSIFSASFRVIIKCDISRPLL